uniref:VWFD domain-containing protein n=1 Tax=Callorhinchus milii TaxID=7868 RepID=A0A4W3GUH7_CALMI
MTTHPALTNCTAVNPPRKLNETWMLSNCTMAICEGNNIISVVPMTCPSVQPITCQNGRPPKKVYDKFDCCYHYECDCICSGWGDPHYLTFDGTYYTFQGNCTYILVKQITEVIENFKIYLENYFCDAQEGLSCPKAITIFYKSSVITLTQSIIKGNIKTKVLLNNNEIVQPFEEDFLRITTSNIAVKAEIIDINATIIFDGMSFIVILPYKIFGENTEGQCGTCTNDRKDDCTLPDGTQVSSCSHAAGFWYTEDKSKPYCEAPSPTVIPPSQPTKQTTTPIDCEPLDVCKIILSDIFAECHNIIPPGPFHEACIFDGCRMKNTTVDCSSLATYAQMCKLQAGICVNWRESTNGECPYTCPDTMIYEPCGPKQQLTCSLRYTDKSTWRDESTFTEGCFCPDGKFLFVQLDMCVDVCGKLISFFPPVEGLYFSFLLLMVQFHKHS